MAVQSQAPVANFSANTTQGCAALSVSFKDVSTGNPKFWNWDFGNGQLSNQQNPSTVYFNPGTYTVSLVVRNADGTNGVTKTGYITVDPAPQADFTSDFTSACLPVTIQFKDLSKPVSGTLTKWEWDFGDGTSSVLQNPSKSYTATGFYTVTLKVTSSTGCVNINTKARYIRVLEGVKAAFKDTVTRVCQPPFNASFSNQTSGPGTLTYNWSFGNGGTATTFNANTTYSSPGTYTVKLSAKSDLGCTDSVQRSIVIGTTNTSFTSADSACINSPVVFRNTSAPIPVSSAWNFGDGTGSQQTNPTKSYTAPGTYQVKLVNTYSSCVDSVTRTIRIPAPPAADFNSSGTTVACKAPLSVGFRDQSAGAVQWLWNFGDGSATSTQQNPSHNYTTAGEYTVTLTITTASGCQNTVSKTSFVKIIKPTVSIGTAPAGGCVPFVFNPYPATNAVDGLASVLWDFGEGGATSTTYSPTYTYNNPGNYTVKLKITTQGGCTDSVTLANAVVTGTKATVDFTANRVQSCVDSVITFKNLSSPIGTATWDFGDGTTSAVTDATHSYKKDGTYDVTLTTTNNGCPSTIKKPQYITVLPPIAAFSYKTDCTTQLTVSFTNQSSIDPNSPVSYLWQFGDAANSTSTQKDPAFTYPSFGNYTVKLTVTNGGCTNTLTQTVSLNFTSADFSITPKDTVCKHTTIRLLCTAYVYDNIELYEWKQDNGPFFGGYPDRFYTLDTNGTFRFTLAIRDKSGCKDTVSKLVTVIGPTANFTATNSVGCRNTTVTFNDASTPKADIVKWTFNFGDGTTQSFTAPPFTHLYKDTGSYTVALTIQDKGGCSDTYTVNNMVRITVPVVNFKADKTVSCPGSTLQFTDSTSGLKPFQYTWSFGDGTTSTLQNPTHAYPRKDTAYSVSLSVQDSTGCTDSLTKLRYIQVKVPTSLSSIKDSTSICPPLATKFYNQSKNYESFTWDFGDSSTSSLDSPTHFYGAYGTYIAKLYAVGFGGCIDSSQHVITLSDPYATSIKYSPLSNCNSLLVDFTIQPPTGINYTFYFGDGTADTTKKTSFQHFYSTANFYSPYMVLTDNAGCLAGVGGQDVIKVIGADPLFSPDKKAFCDSGTVYFTNYTIGNDPVTAYNWDFGDGSTSSDKDPIHTFMSPGRYVVSLSVNTQNGCSKSITDTIRVYGTPAPAIISDSSVCINSTLTFKAQLSATDTAVVLNWNFGNGATSTAASPTVKYDKEGRYTIGLTVTNPQGCKGTASKSVTITPLPVVTVADNPYVPLGASIPLPVTYSNNIATYNWTPATNLSCTNCAVPVASPVRTTTYQVNVTDSNGCTNSGEITVNVACNENNYFVPNLFTPNGDGNNDVFYPRGTSIHLIQSLRVFNRWGEMVFEKRNFAANSAANGWDGMYKGKPAPADAYVYIMEFICGNGTIIPYKGNITLVR
ncbi:MAG: PKD domain-containing protein [Williamsia sp.]|nr:PKD domain-containing protein [Williamsia sp.]